METLFRLIPAKCVYPERKLVVELSCVKSTIQPWKVKIYNDLSDLKKVSY